MCINFWCLPLSSCGTRWHFQAPFPLFVKWNVNLKFMPESWSEPRWLSGRETTCQCRDEGYMGSIPGSGRFPGGGNHNPLQYSCLKNPMDRGAWWAMVHGVTKSWTQPSNWVCMHAEVRGPEKPSPKILILYLIGLLWGPHEQSYVEVFCKLLRKYMSITHSYMYAKWNEKMCYFKLKRNKSLKILYVERVNHTIKNFKKWCGKFFCCVDIYVCASVFLLEL